MKSLFIIIIAILFYNNVFSQGINFEDGTFADVLAKAKAENKMVFMDCYTVWCGPCKKLEKEVFPQKEVGDYFNTRFVSIKVDTQKGEGIELQKKYEVKVYPTLLFMDATGEVVHTKVGGADAAGLIAEAKLALDPSRRIKTLEERYAKGDRGLNFLANYFRALRRAYRIDEMKAVGKEYLSATPVNHLSNVEAFTILMYTGIEYGGREYVYILENKSKFIENKQIDQRRVDNVLSTAISNYLKKLAKTGTLTELELGIEKCKKDFVLPQQEMIETELRYEAIRNHCEKVAKTETLAELELAIEKCKKDYNFLKLEAMEKELRCEFYLLHKQFDKWFDEQEKTADALMATDKNRAFSEYINTVYRITADSIFETAGIYDKAIEMTLKAKEIDDSSMGIYESLAHLYYKEGDKQKALENINIYITKLAEQGGKIYPEVEQLKKNIESMK